MTLPAIKTEDIRAQIIASVEFQIGNTIPILPKAFTRALATALAGLVQLTFRGNAFTFLQLWVATASNKPVTANGRTVIPLQEHGLQRGVGLPKPATSAEHDVSATVTTVTGATIPAGTQMLSAVNGITYLTTASVLIDAATISLPVIAAGDQAGGTGAGAIGNLDPGQVVSFTTAPVGVLQDTTVTVQTVTGADAESEDAYRQRVLDRDQKPPQGGAPADYEAWAEGVEGILNAYPYLDSPGVVDVYVEATEESSGSADGIPTAAQLLAVETAIELNDGERATRRPFGAFVKARPITRKGFRVQVAGLDAQDSNAVKASVEGAMATVFANFEPFIGGLSVYRRARVTQAAVGGEVATIVTAAGGTIAAVVLQALQTTRLTVSPRVIAADDDAAQAAGGAVTLGDTPIAMGGVDRYAAFRITGVAIPAGATIVSASLAFTAAASEDAYVDYAVRGEAVADAAALAASANNISSRALTAAEVFWTPAGWALDSVNETPDLASVIQEIIEVDGWASGNAMNFVVRTLGPGSRGVASFETDPGKTAVLTVVYDVEGVTYDNVDVYELGIGEKAKLESVVFS